MFFVYCFLSLLGGASSSYFSKSYHSALEPPPLFILCLLPLLTSLTFSSSQGQSFRRSEKFLYQSEGEEPIQYSQDNLDTDDGGHPQSATPSKPPMVRLASSCPTNRPQLIILFFFFFFPSSSRTFLEILSSPPSSSPPLVIPVHTLFFFVNLVQFAAFAKKDFCFFFFSRHFSILLTSFLNSIQMADVSPPLLSIARFFSPLLDSSSIASLASSGFFWLASSFYSFFLFFFLFSFFFFICRDLAIDLPPSSFLLSFWNSPSPPPHCPLWIIINLHIWNPALLEQKKKKKWERKEKKDWSFFQFPNCRPIRLGPRPVTPLLDPPTFSSFMAHKSRIFPSFPFFPMELDLCACLLNCNQVCNMESLEHGPSLQSLWTISTQDTVENGRFG